ncbi:MAG TPA: hypothetical protein VMP00_05925 [Burkholderiales bacterium]|nr:hypothetical protein [Burkholderiales bacterium]
MIDAAIGVRAHMGWVAIAVIVPDSDDFHVLCTGRVATAAPDDQVALEPYHVAAGYHGLTRASAPADSKALLRKGLARQRRTALAGFRTLARDLEAQGHRIAAAAVLTGRGRPAGTLARALGSHPQIHVEEGLAVRAAVVHALDKLGVTAQACDERSLPARAAMRLRTSEPDLFAHLKRKAPSRGEGWRKEHQLAALAAFMAT